MFDTDPAVLDADATLSDVVAARVVAEQAEVRILSDAAHWADLHGRLDGTAADIGGVSLPGMERLVCLGGDGTPQVAEFAAAEFGAVLGLSPTSASMLIGDALDLRQRLPRLWARIQAGEVRAWVGRRTAQATRWLSQQTVAVVDRRVSRWAHSVSWGRLQAIIDAAVIEADPAGAAEAVEREQKSQGVWLGQSNDHGVKDIWIRTETPAALSFDDRPGRPGPRRRLRSSRPAPRGRSPADPVRRVPLRHQHRPKKRRRPHHPLCRPRRRRTTRPDRFGQPWPDDQAVAPDQDLLAVAGQTGVQRRPRVAITPRPPLHRQPHRHPPHPTHRRLKLRPRRPHLGPDPSHVRCGMINKVGGHRVVSRRR